MCGLVLLCGIYIVALFLAFSITIPYADTYADELNIEMPDKSGILGGSLLGFFLAWVLLPPASTKVRD